MNFTQQASTTQCSPGFQTLGKKTMNSGPLTHKTKRKTTRKTTRKATMKTIKLSLALMLLSLILSACSIFEGRPQEDSINQAEGTSIWMDHRLNEEQTAKQLDGQFGDQTGDANYNRPQAIDNDRSFPEFNK